MQNILTFCNGNLNKGQFNINAESFFGKPKFFFLKKLTETETTFKGNIKDRA